MSIWQVKIHQNTIWGGSSRQYGPAKINEIFKHLLKEFGIRDYILTVGHEAMEEIATEP